MELTIDQALQKGIEAHKAGEFQEADRYYTAILKENPKHPNANHGMGVLAAGISKLEMALPYLKNALEANPSVSQFWLSYIDALVKLDRISDAKAVFDQAKRNGAKGDAFDQIENRLGSAISKISNVQEPPKAQLNALIKLYNQNRLIQVFDEAQKLTKRYTKSLALWNLMGASAAQLGRLDDAILAFQQALSIKPDYAEAYNNMGNALKEKGKLAEAIEAFNKALSFKPDYADAYNNMGNALQDQGKLEEAIQAYTKALSIKPDYATAHYNLSSIKKYNSDDKHFLQVKELYDQKGLSDGARCQLSFALAKMYEDIGKLDKAYSHLSEGNALRKKLLNYSIDQDKSLFTKLKITQPKILKNSLKIGESSTDPTPIFILGMPRSGTTLVEQIISSHFNVTGAGELNYIKQFGIRLATGDALTTTLAISTFRDKYLSELSKVSNGKSFVTDKMPHNFRFIPLICAAFPDAKIVHVQRNAAATCWSNFKQYFDMLGLGYCYDLQDIVSYYNLYKDLMQLWQIEYDDRIYNLNYENLTTDQENETRKLVKYLELNWEEACLSPHKNKRSVGTASQQQVRKKVYTGSSEVWFKYKPFLNGAFDGLTP